MSFAASSFVNKQLISTLLGLCRYTVSSGHSQVVQMKQWPVKHNTFAANGYLRQVLVSKRRLQSFVSKCWGEKGESDKKINDLQVVQKRGTWNIFSWKVSCNHSRKPEERRPCQSYASKTLRALSTLYLKPLSDTCFDSPMGSTENLKDWICWEKAWDSTPTLFPLCREQQII